jgi:hypothetical protein
MFSDEWFTSKFLTKTVRDEKTGCLVWVGSRNPSGYGQIRLNDVMYKAHRVSATKHGVLPNISSELCVCHKCDNPSCVDPDHLFAGSARDNNNDRHSKDRDFHPAGELHNLAVLTYEHLPLILAMRLAGRTVTEIGRLFGVSHRTISAFCCGHTWKNSNSTETS